MSAVKYRPEIDGLRAVAVMPVVFYHAHLGFTGGYVGVDVFFVISGYLITGLVLKEIEQRRFTLVSFWERRIRRLFPALFLVMTATLLAGGLIDLPSDFESLGGSALAQAMLVANVHFWRDSGYFAGGAETKPLLHTWSLAVEEQFYLLFPLLLVVFWRRWMRGTRMGVWCVLVVSLALSIYGTYRHPRATFYLLPMRGWELMIGALLAIHAEPASTRRWLNEALSWVGLAAILASCWFYDQDTRFPGTAALVPCLGTAAILYSNNRAMTSLGRLLALKPVVFIGLISYSLYLFHWPILVYGNRIFFEGMSVGLKLVLIAAGLVMAVLSWRFVELPFRKRQLLKTRKTVFAFGGLCTAVTLVVAVVILQTDGLPQRLPNDVLTMAGGNSHPQRSMVEPDISSGNLSLLGDPTADPSQRVFLLWGDSHAGSIAKLLDTLATEHDIPGYAATRFDTTPILETWRPIYGTDARTYNRAVLRFIREHPIEHVLLVSRWTANVAGLPNGSLDSLITETEGVEPTPASARDAFAQGLSRTVAALVEAGAHVWIMRQVPLQAFDVPQALATCMVTGRDGSGLGVPIDMHRAHRAWVDGVLDGLQGPAVTLLDPDPYLFDDSGRAVLIKDGHSMYREHGHISDYGALYLRPLFVPVFSNLTAE